MLLVFFEIVEHVILWYPGRMAAIISENPLPLTRLLRQISLDRREGQALRYQSTSIFAPVRSYTDAQGVQAKAVLLQGRCETPQISSEQKASPQPTMVDSDVKIEHKTMSDDDLSRLTVVSLLRQLSDCARQGLVTADQKLRVKRLLLADGDVKAASEELADVKRLDESKEEKQLGYRRNGVCDCCLGEVFMKSVVGRTWNTLSSDLLLIIFRFLESIEFATLSVCCRDFNATATRDLRCRSIWKVLATDMLGHCDVMQEMHKRYDAVLLSMIYRASDSRELIGVVCICLVVG